MRALIHPSLRVGLCAALALVSARAVAGPPATPPGPPGATGAAAAPAAPVPEPAPTWRFRKKDRPVKVVLLAGSIGAWPKSPYIKRFEQMCSRVETKNISKVGMGAYALKKRFKQQVLENRWLDFRQDPAQPEREYWLVFQGGLNSVGMPEKTNRYIRDIFVLAHRRGMGVVGLSLTPWGDTTDAKRWRNAADALRYLASTQAIVDFVVGRASPRAALGVHEAKRAQPGSPWTRDELADVGVDLYDSALRQRDAPLRDEDQVLRELEGDRRWRARRDALPAAQRSAWVAGQVRLASEIPTWWLRSELRAFDHIHPNTEGHAALAQMTCPQLPQSWGCSCHEAQSVVAADPAAVGPALANPYF